MRDIKTIVGELIKKHKTNNPYLICDKLKIKIMYAELGSVNGYYIQVPKHQIIYINKNLHDKHKEFVCAHELGHAIMHKGMNTFFLQRNTLNIKGKFELQANRFASELIIPDDLILKYEGQSIDFISKSENINILLLNLKFNN